MNCFWCDSELIWGGDQDTEDNPEFSVETNLSCPRCYSEITVLKREMLLINDFWIFKEIS